MVEVVSTQTDPEQVDATARPPAAVASRRVVPSRPAGLLRDLEAQWRGELRAASLIAEIEAPDVDVRRAIRALGRVYDDAWYEDDQRLLLYRRYPACLAVSLAGIGAIEYSHGTYWPMLWEHAGVEPGPAGQHLWANAFGAALDRFKLARFRNLPHRYLGEILMHAGVPDFCLEDLLNLILEQEAHNPDLTAQSFIAWASAPHYASRLNSLDKPARRFLQSGNDYAEDFIDRCLELIDRLHEPAFDAAGLHLPVRVIERARALAEDGRISLRKRSTRAKKYRTSKAVPHFVLEPFGRGLLVQLPAVDDAPAGQVSWQIQADDLAETITSSSPWPTSRGAAPSTAFSINRPVRKVRAANSRNDDPVELDLVDPDDPILVFTDEGSIVPASSSVPAEPVWLLSPDASEPGGGDIVFDGQYTELDETPPPHGWNGWRLRLFDAAKARGVKCGAGPWHPIHQSRRARLEVMTPLANVRATGAQVLDRVPGVELPADAETTTSWSIRVRRPGATTPLCSTEVRISEDTTLDPWAKIDRPLVGAYEVTARGPLGRGFSRTVHLVEGLQTESNPEWRPIGLDGLEAAKVHAWAGLRGLRVDSSVAELGPDEPTARFAISGPDGETTVEITPPHMAVKLVPGDSNESWSVRPVHLSTESLGELSLHIRLPAPMATKLVARSAGKDLQTITSASTRGRAEAIFDLSRLVDTIRVAGAAQIELEVETLRYPVGRCQPRRLAEGVTMSGAGTLVLEGGIEVDGLVAGVYQAYAPWRPPVVVPVVEETMTAPLPAVLANGGPLEVALRIVDPWVPEPWPAWPTGRDVFRLPGGPWAPDHVCHGETQLSKLLAGSDGYTVTDSVPYAASLYARHDDLLRYREIPSARDIAAAVIAHQPAGFIHHVASGRATAARIEAPLIHAGLAMLSPKPYIDHELELALWAVSPIAAILASSHSLRQMDDSMVERVEDLCGPTGKALVLGEDDPGVGAGAFDAAQPLAQMSKEQLDALWSEACVVPQGLLSIDERVAAARQLFDARERPGLRRLASEASRLGKEIRRQVAQARGTGMAKSIGARGLDGGWQALSGYSLALAFLARLAARDPERFGSYRQHITHHAVLARHAPRLVTVDLILAELHLIGTDLA